MSRNAPRGKRQWVRPIPEDCKTQNVDWKAFLNDRLNRPFDAHKFINWRFCWEFSGGNVTENMVHQIGWIIGALDLGLPTAAYMSVGLAFSLSFRLSISSSIILKLLPTRIAPYPTIHYASSMLERRVNPTRKVKIFSRCD
jgi:hypothetical protein